jgi:riboflavin kinase/FMN adenylyltransferase
VSTVKRDGIVWHDLSDVPEDWPGCVVTIGVFDGFHRGHQALLRRARERARRLGVPLLLMTFDPHPRSVTRPDSAPVLLLSVAERVAMAHALGVDVVLVVPFTPACASTPAEEFVGQTLVASLKVRAVVVGANFRFGAGGRGDISTLQDLSLNGGFDVEVVRPVETAGRTCSSTEVRRCLAEGDTWGIRALLGRRHLRALPGLVSIHRHRLAYEAVDGDEAEG